MKSNRSSTLVAEHVRGRRLPVMRSVAAIKAGLPVREFDDLRALLELSVEDMANKLGVSTATLSRRRRDSLPLGSGPCDRLLRFARLFRLATDLYDGNQNAARAWLKAPSRALGGVPPLEFADTEAGARGVEQLIGRLDNSVYT